MLKAGQKPLMTFSGIPSTRMGQVIASTGLDGIIIDCEHGQSACRLLLVYVCSNIVGHIGDDMMHNHVVAIAGQGVSPLIRIRSPAPDLIKRALDTGAQ